MKFLVVLAVAIACISADVSHLKNDYAPIVKSNFDISPEGAFSYQYETGNGIYEQASGAVKNQNSDYPSLEVKGAFKYTAPDGTPVELSYVANENGFQPVGSHIPVPPPTPEPILRALEFIAANSPRLDATAIKPKFG